MKSFKKVYIEITNVCNLSCEFCPKTSRAPKRNTKADFTHIIESVKSHTDHVYFHLLGEPTMHPELEEYLAISHEHGLKVNLTTNGTLIHKVDEILISAPALRQVNISLHSFESNDAKVNMEEYIKGITKFVNQATEKSSVICSLRLWNMDSEELKAKNQLNDAIFDLLEKELDLEIDIREALQEKQGIKLKKNVYLNMAEKFEWPEQSKEANKESCEEVFCYGLRDQIGILVDGTVVPCCLDSEGKMALGNIFESSLEDIIASERSQRIYQGFSNRRAVESMCQSCGYAKRYSKGSIKTV